MLNLYVEVNTYVTPWSDPLTEVTIDGGLDKVSEDTDNSYIRVLYVPQLIFSKVGVRDSKSQRFTRLPSWKEKSDWLEKSAFFLLLLFFFLYPVSYCAVSLLWPAVWLLMWISLKLQSGAVCQMAAFVFELHNKK